MPKIVEFLDHDATQDKFVSFEFGSDSMWSIHPDISSVTPGTGKYTILAGNIDTLEVNMVPYRTLSEDLSLSDPIDSESFRFRYFGIKYTAGTATGTLNIYLEQKIDK